MHPHIDYSLATAAADEPFTLVQAKEHLRVVDDSDDDLIGVMLSAAVAHVQKDIRRQLMTAVWEARMSAFPSRGVRRGCGEPYGDYLVRRYGIPLTPWPLGAVTSISYVNEDGDETVLGAETYEVLDGDRACVVPAYNTSWPVARDKPGSVVVTFAAGYGVSDAGRAAVPKAVVQYMKLFLLTMYENRATEVTGTITSAMKYADGLIDPWRVY